MTWYDLTQPFHAEMPHSASLPSPTFETLSRVAEDGANVQRYSAPTHVGTHVDAPLHFVAGGDAIDDLPPDRFTGRGVLLDLHRSEPVEIPLEAVETAAEAAGGVTEGDIVLVRTGWGATFDDEQTYQRYPWLAPDVADWLVARGAKLLAVDTISPDRPRAMRPDDWNAYPHHRTLLPEDVLIAEHLYLEELAAAVAEPKNQDGGHDPGNQTSPLEVFGFPIKLQGGDGAPARFVARV